MRYRLTPAQRQAIRDRVLAAGGIGALVGAKGSGKTTLLEDIAGDLDAIEHKLIRLGDERSLPERPLVGLSSGAWLLLDSAGHLGWWAARRLSRQCRRSGINLLLTRHQPGPEPVVHQHATDLTLMRNVLQELVPDDWQRYLPVAEAAFVIHAGNLREVWRACYDTAGMAASLSRVD